MKLRTKLIVGFSILLFLMCALAGIGIKRLYSINHSLRDAYGVMYLHVQRDNQIQLELSELARSMANILITDEPGSFNANMDKVRQASFVLEQRLASISGPYSTPEEEQFASNARGAIQELLSYKDRLTGLLLQGLRREAVELGTGEGLQLQQNAFDQASRLLHHHEEILDVSLEHGASKNVQTQRYTIILTVVGLILGLIVIYIVLYSISRGLNSLIRVIDRYSNGLEAFDPELPPDIRQDEFGDVVQAFHIMAEQLKQKEALEREYTKDNEDQAWVKTQVAQMTIRLQGLKDIKVAAGAFLKETAPLIGALSGAFYLLKDQGGAPFLELAGSYAQNSFTREKTVFALGEGLVGQCARDKRKLSLGYAGSGSSSMLFSTSLGLLEAAEMTVIPVVYKEDVIAVVEWTVLEKLKPLQKELLDQLVKQLGEILSNMLGSIKVDELLRVSQQLTEELQHQSRELIYQQDELRASYLKLEEQTKALQQSEEKLQKQQEELEIINQELTWKTQLLEEQIRKSKEIKESLKKQAREMARISQYKSEFMANISHELRTPLNSVLVLSEMLGRNKEENLTPKQSEYISTIHEAGCHLLHLIDSVLESAKVESGQTELLIETVPVQEIVAYVQRNFEPLAISKGIRLTVQQDPDAPVELVTDSRRVLQIIGNLLSNALKFTPQGQVSFHIGNGANGEAVFTVRDTGIGIAPDKQTAIFEAFRQADRTTIRRFGGIGLGLSISKELAHKLGGHITVESQEGVGSTFTFYLPTVFQGRTEVRTEGAVHRTEVSSLGQPVRTFIKAGQAESPRYFGLQETAAAAERSETAHASAAVSSRSVKRILLAVTDPEERASIRDHLEGPGMELYTVNRGSEALEAFQQGGFDAFILDIALADMSGIKLIEQMNKDHADWDIPLFALAEEQIAPHDEHHLHRLGARVILKKGRFCERLVDELGLTWDQQLAGSASHAGEGAKPHPGSWNHATLSEELYDKHLLLVLQDIRQVYSITALMEQYGMQVSCAENEEQVMIALKEAPQIGLAIIDVASPALNGHAIIRKIRSYPQYGALPILALTSRSSREDPLPALEEGASDYLETPIDSGRLVSLAKEWLAKAD